MEGEERPLTGFERPMIVSDAIADFFRGADLGLVDNNLPEGPDNPPVQAGLDLLFNQRISNAALLTGLFSLYAAQNGLAFLADSNIGKPPETQDLVRLGADDAMREIFADTFERLTESDEYLDRLTGPNIDRRSGRVVPPFNPDDFLYASFQSIMMLNMANPRGDVIRRRIVRLPDGRRETFESRPIPVPLLTPDLENRLEDPRNLRRLREETDFVRNILANRRAIMDAERRRERISQRLQQRHRPVNQDNDSDQDNDNDDDEDQDDE